MSRLLHPGLGDYADRLSILTLKIEAADRQSLSTTHLRAERSEILGRIVSLRAEFDFRWDDLAAINRRIWRLVDHIEAVGKFWPHVEQERDVYDLAAAAVELQTLNRARAELVWQISGPETPKEKLC